MKLSKLLIISILALYPASAVFSMEDADSEAAATKRNTLTIRNDTARDEGGSARDLYLLWEEDVHQPPQVTERLAVGLEDSRQSKGIGRGDNIRNFKIKVSRWRDEDKREIGSFTHSIYAGPFSSGVDETTTLFKNYTSDTVELWREYYKVVGDDIQKLSDPVGSLPREDW